MGKGQILVLPITFTIGLTGHDIWISLITILYFRFKWSVIKHISNRYERMHLVSSDNFNTH